MSADAVSRIEYSDKYQDDKFEFRCGSVALATDLLPRKALCLFEIGRGLTWNDWRFAPSLLPLPRLPH